MLHKRDVDLIVVAASSLETVKLKQSLLEICKTGLPKEASVIFGSPEVPKLFSLSHNS